MRHGCMLVLFVLGITVGLGPADTQADAVGSAVTFDRMVHFTAPDGGDIQVASGTYQVEPAANSSLRLVSGTGQAPIETKAVEIAHEEALTSPIAMVALEEGQDDEVHLVLLLPSGQGFDATGSFSGTRSRGALGSALSRVQVQSAVSQIPKIQQAPPPQSSPLPPIAIVRVPSVTADASSAPVSKTIQLKPAGRVTWDYLRMNDPDLIVEIITEVQAGRLDKNILTGLASPAKVSELLAQNYTSLKNQYGDTGTTPSSSGALTVDNRWAEVLNPKISEQLAPAGGIAALKTKVGGFSPAIRDIVIRTIPRADYSPAQLNLGSVYNGQKRTGTISVIAPVDSIVTASLPRDGKPFRILKARALSGKLAFEVSAANKLTPGPVLNETYASTTPPFQINVKSGQRVEYEVLFEPHFVLFGNEGNPVGNYATTLQVDSDKTWFAGVPIIGRFEGVALGVIGMIDDNDITVIYDGTPCDQLVDVPASMTFINAEQQTMNVSVSAASISRSLKLQPFNVSIGPGQSKKVPIPLKRTSCMQEGVQYNGTLKYSYPGVERRADFGVTFYPNVFHWEDTGDVGSCHYTTDVFAHPDGATAFNVTFRNKNLVLQKRFIFRFSVLGRRIGSSVLDDGPNTVTTKIRKWVLHQSFIAENYIRLDTAIMQQDFDCHGF